VPGGPAIVDAIAMQRTSRRDIEAQAAAAARSIPPGRLAEIDAVLNYVDTCSTNCAVQKVAGEKLADLLEGKTHDVLSPSERSYIIAKLGKYTGSDYADILRGVLLDRFKPGAWDRRYRSYEPKTALASAAARLMQSVSSDWMRTPGFESASVSMRALAEPFGKALVMNPDAAGDLWRLLRGAKDEEPGGGSEIRWFTDGALIRPIPRQAEIDEVLNNAALDLKGSGAEPAKAANNLALLLEGRLLGPLEPGEQSKVMTQIEKHAGSKTLRKAVAERFAKVISYGKVTSGGYRPEDPASRLAWMAVCLTRGNYQAEHELIAGLSPSAAYELGAVLRAHPYARANLTRLLIVATSGARSGASAESAREFALGARGEAKG
jgi:hypothetical protein